MDRNDIRDARIRAGLTQLQLAEMIGREQPAISKIESGAQAVSVETAPALAAAIGMSVLDLLYPPRQQDESAA